MDSNTGCACLQVKTKDPDKDLDFVLQMVPVNCCTRSIPVIGSAVTSTSSNVQAAFNQSNALAIEDMNPRPLNPKIIKS